jgi:hypothetical protein
MTPQEREMLEELLARLGRTAPQPQDAEARGLIEAEMRRRPDAAYTLAQTALVQDLALQRAQERIGQLERELETARTAARPAQPASFLGGILEGGPWGQRRAADAPPPSPAFAPPAGAGSFLRGAATAAAGVAGGMLAAEALGSLFHGAHDPFGGFGGAGGFLSSGALRPTADRDWDDQGGAAFDDGGFDPGPGFTDV